MVIKNNIYSVEITGFSHDGNGVGRIDGFTIFVPNTIPGEVVEALVIKINKTYCIGKVKNIIKASSDRITPWCNISEKCGGCNLQHISYERQLVFKKDFVYDSLTRIGKLKDFNIQNTIGMKEPINYRNKAAFPLMLDGNSLKIGFYANMSHKIINCTYCGIQTKDSNKIIEILRYHLYKNRVSIYNEETHHGLLRHIVIRKGFKTNEIMVTLVVNSLKTPDFSELVKSLINQISNIKSIYVNLNNEKTNVILGETNVKIFGEDCIYDYLDCLKFKISPLSFFQVNPIQTEVLYAKAIEFAGLNGNEIVCDLYSGTGTISLFAAKHSKKVYGIEIVKDAVDDANKNKELNDISNVEFICGDVGAEVKKIEENIDVVFVDPPRKGCEKELLDLLMEIKPKRIVYISCNPSTLARDLEMLCKEDYTVVEVQPVDMFPWTRHVECVVRIEKL